MTINDSNPHGPLSEERLRRFETEHGLSLPPDYRVFLLAHNGGEPQPSLITFVERGRETDDRVRRFRGIHDGLSRGSLDDGLEVFRGRIPTDCLPIASDCFGNQFLLRVSGSDAGTVYFWDHEIEEPEGEEDDWTPPRMMGNMIPLAESFTAFLAALKE